MNDYVYSQYSVLDITKFVKLSSFLELFIIHVTINSVFHTKSLFLRHTETIMQNVEDLRRS